MHDTLGLVVECPVHLTESNRDELRLLYADLRDHYARRDAREGTRTTLHFVWSGVLDPELFGATYADQRHIFVASRPVINSARGADLPESLRHGVCTA